MQSAIKTTFSIQASIKQGTVQTSLATFDLEDGDVAHGHISSHGPAMSCRTARAPRFNGPKVIRQGRHYQRCKPSTKLGLGSGNCPQQILSFLLTYDQFIIDSMTMDAWQVHPFSQTDEAFAHPPKPEPHVPQNKKT